MKNIIILGAPGSGKGTNAKRLSECFNIPHISTGDIFRENIKNKTGLGILVQSVIEKGMLVSDDIVNKLVEDRLSKNDVREGYVLDGYPRTVEQAKALDAMTKITVVINLTINDETIINRLGARRVCICGESYNLGLEPNIEKCNKCGKDLFLRNDDKPETIKIRLEEYKNKTFPLIEFYQSKGLLENIQADLDSKFVTENIIKMMSILK